MGPYEIDRVPVSRIAAQETNVYIAVVRQEAA